MELQKATPAHLDIIWTMLQDGIQRRKAEGSNQWQDGYPNREVVQKDLDNGHGYLLVNDDQILGYFALLINDEPAYDALEGSWLTNGDFVVYHRVIISAAHLGKGFAKQMLQLVEQWALHQGIKSLKADTNFDNASMLHLFDSLGYQYCGQVYFRGSARRAYEKVLD